MKTLKHSAIALIASGIALTNIAAAADLEGTVFAKIPNSWQHSFQGMSQAERNLSGQMTNPQRDRDEYRSQGGNGSGDASQTRSRSQQRYADGSDSQSGYGRGYSDRQSGGHAGGGGGRGRR